MVVICFPIRFEIPLRHQVFEHVQRQKLIAQPALVAMGIAVSDRLPGAIYSVSIPNRYADHRIDWAIVTGPLSPRIHRSTTQSKSMTPDFVLRRAPAQVAADLLAFQINLK